MFRGAGPKLFRATLDAVVSRPDADRLWYLSAVTAMAAEGLVRTAPIDGLEWAEIDYPKDLRIAEQLVSGWSTVDEKLAFRSTA